MQCTICKNWGHTGKVCPNSDEMKKMKSEGRMHYYFCGKHGHTHPDCPELRLWQIQTGGQQEMEHLLKLDIQNATIPFWVAAPKDFSDFISCIEEAFKHCSPHAGGVLIRPKWQIDRPDLGGDWPKSPVTVRKQKFIKRRPGVYTADYEKPKRSRVELFQTKATLAELDKAGSFNISTSKSFWNSALTMFDNIATSKKYPIYVIDKEGTFFLTTSLQQLRSLGCGLTSRSLGGVVLGGLGVVTGRCVSCCRGVGRRCGLVSAIGRHWHTFGRPSHQRYTTNSSTMP
ncbi:hypothetical protein DAPPUDRAFT_95627 [Daphnia pulex]|uniref:CCHC-type domain-containing protein n=1 Tax=Daphnia pulex TaxID=6669 RepID=E9FW95_DAPPU|nr:hypothetical protein DAPPUDRAFT_95627 [Daphnia pulex]|eukprot:EFX88964.1 hypothetical protein DAPPUDRAFT_95627 [Daphnia pulex]